MGKAKFTDRKLKQYLDDAESIKFLRNNPVVACELLLGIKLTDSQKIMLIEAWNKPYVVFNCSRNFGKSFLIAVIVMLKALLYEDQRIYIVSNSGSQAQETFTKMEDIAKSNISSIDFLDMTTGRMIDIFVNELVKGSNSDGFIHDKSSFKVTLYNDSRIYTLNSIPNNVRGKRATLLCIDESCFCSEELITAVLPFLTQDSDFKTSTNKNFNTKTVRKAIPNQVIYASSAGDIDSKHAKVYKEYALRMIAGDDRYFVADMPCDIPLQPYIDGEPSKPYLTQETIDAEMRVNPSKAMREYYNKFQNDSSEDQMIKWAQVRRNETFAFPVLSKNNKYESYIVGFDPARTNDNSIVGVMGVYKNENGEYIGDVIHMINLIDMGKKKKMQMKSPDQIRYIRNMILDYNGDSRDYENILKLMVDDGSGGGGVTAYGDNLLEDWIGKDGLSHKGFIDPTHKLYEEEVDNYPNASNVLKLVTAVKSRMSMCDDLIKNMREDAIKFPREYSNKGYITEESSSGEITQRELAFEEEISLINIDALKSEMTSIYAFKNSIGEVTRYALPKDKERTHHDDRWYVMLMLSSKLAELRREQQLNKTRNKTEDNWDDFLVFGW